MVGHSSSGWALVKPGHRFLPELHDKSPDDVTNLWPQGFWTKQCHLYCHWVLAQQRLHKGRHVPSLRSYCMKQEVQSCPVRHFPGWPTLWIMQIFPVTNSQSVCRANVFLTVVPPQLFYGPFFGTTRVSQCQKRRELLDIMLQGKINRGRHTDHPAGRHSIQTNQCPTPPSPHIFYRPDALPAAQPTASRHWRQISNCINSW